jgi:hypothetical protein
MKIIACLTVLAFILTGCTTLRTVDLTPPSLQERILESDLIKPGNRVRITTGDGKEYRFRVRSISGGNVMGKNVEIPIKDISRVEIRRFSAGKTIVLVGAIILSGVIMVNWLESNLAFMGPAD